jgi:hypothetical protein
MAKRWAIYDYDTDELVTTLVYPSYEEAAAAADRLDNALVVALGDVFPDSEPPEEEDTVWPAVSDAERNKIQQRLEYLRGELRAERISYDGLLELQSLAPHIDPEDTELLQAAGVPEFPDEEPQ